MTTAAAARERARRAADLLWPGIPALEDRYAAFAEIETTPTGSLWLRACWPNGARHHGLIASAREIADGSFKALFAPRVNAIMAATPQGEAA
jgi:hypothetical protein